MAERHSSLIHLEWTASTCTIFSHKCKYPLRSGKCNCLSEQVQNKLPRSGEVSCGLWVKSSRIYLFVVVQSLSCVWLLATPQAAARQASLSSAISWSLLKFHIHRVGDAICLPTVYSWLQWQSRNGRVAATKTTWPAKLKILTLCMRAR